MSPPALPDLLSLGQLAPSAAVDFLTPGQAVTLVLIVVVVVAIALIVTATRVLGRLVRLLLAGVWINLKVVALLAFLLVCLSYLVVRGA